MFEAFPSNYVWNLSVNLALGMGGEIGEIDGANRKILSAAQDEDAATGAFFESWCELADRLVEQARVEEGRGHELSAGARYARACAYYVTAERMQSPDFAPRRAAYAKVLSTFTKTIELLDPNCEQVSFPYRGSTVSGLMTRAANTRDPCPPCMVFCNGLDSSKEMIYLAGIGRALNLRGICVLIVDQPGTGDALRLRNLPAVVESEQWAGPAVDYLQSRSDVDPERIGMMGWSLGGYYSPRAAAFEKRFKLCVAWGANHNWGEMQRKRLQNSGKNPVPHYWEHVMWVWGKSNLEDYMAFVPRITREGVIDKITVPLLITHGANDRQIPVEYAHQSFREASGTKDKTLRIFDAADSSVEHCNVDNLEPARSYISDWIVDAFQRLACRHS
jgi:dienelactone hydrolase